IQGAPWGAVAVGLKSVSLALTAGAVLDHVHQLSATSTIKRSVHVQSYLLAHTDQLHKSFPDTYGIDVELTRGGAPPIRTTLTTDQPEKNVDVAFSLEDILAGASPEQPTFTFRTRNLMTSGTGPWSAPETLTGRELMVAPLAP